MRNDISLIDLPMGKEAQGGEEFSDPVAVVGTGGGTAGQEVLPSRTGRSGNSSAKPHTGSRRSGNGLPHYR